MEEKPLFGSQIETLGPPNTSLVFRAHISQKSESNSNNNNKNKVKYFCLKLVRVCASKHRNKQTKTLLLAGRTI